MSNKSLYFILVLLLLALGVKGQQKSSLISGRVLDISGNPLELATVMLHPQDTSIIKTSITDTNGLYTFEHVIAGSYFVEILMPGFAPRKLEAFTISDGQDINLQDAIMHQSATSLKEVEVSAKKAMVVRKQDRTIVNVDAFLSGAGTTALDILSKSPGVQVDQNGIISLRSKQGVNVFIDDKPTYLSGEDLANYLRSLPSSSLEQVELMTNPPARYDAAGNAGIINIKLKRNRKKDWNGALNLSMAQGEMTRSNNNANISYNNSRFSSFASMGYSLNNSFTDLDLRRRYKDSEGNDAAYFNQKSYFNRHGNTATATGGVDYYLSDRATAGIVLNGMLRNSSQVNDNTSNIFDAAKVPDSIIVAKNMDDIRFQNGSININFRQELGKNKQQLTGDGNYLVYRNRTNQNYHNSGYTADNVLKFQDALLGRLPNFIDIYTIKADYVNPLSKQWKLEAGLKYSNIITDNTADYKTETAGIIEQDYTKSNHFIYKEQISAAYTNISHEAQNLSMQGGIRVEHTLSDGHQLGNKIKPDSAFTRDYINLFPTFYVLYRFDSQARHQIGMNYGKRIDRPYYEDLNPFLYPMDKFTYYTGNPFLKPSITHSLELSYTYDNRITSTFSYSASLDNINETIQILDGIYYSRSGNIGSKKTASLSVDADFNPTKWLNIHGYSEAGNITTSGTFLQKEISTSGNYWFISSNIRIGMGKGWDGELSGNYRTKIYDAQFIIDDISQINVGVQKKFSGKYSLRLSVNDLFYGQVINGTITNLDAAEASWVNKRDTRQLTVSVGYQFGKKTNGKTRYNSAGADAEKNRVKS